MRFILATLTCLGIASLAAGCVPEEEQDHTTDEQYYGTRPPPLQGAQRSWSERSATERGTEQPNKNETSPKTVSKNFNKQLLEWYGQYSNYNLVMQDVKAFYPPLRYNGCVAFMSAALRRLGVFIPIAKSDPESPSLVTRPFSDYLENRLGWRRLSSASSLSEGDIVFTRDNPSYPGYPAHVYLFQSWSNRALGIALVIDNQDFSHERNIYDNDTGFNFTPFSYALRAP
ncbi:MAG: hypothetical protein RJB13_1314 [Pseudomonadota bacterium]|jgi:hypothetical protein